MVFENTAKLLILHYLLHGDGKARFSARVGKVFSLATRKLRHIHMRAYYDLLRSIPDIERRRILACTTLNPAWLRCVQELRFRHRSCDVRLTIISRNCVDIISEWLTIHEKVLAQRHIMVDAIIANKPLDDSRNEYVLELGDLHHFRHAGNGQLHMEGKARFVSRYPVYLGDAAEEVMRDKVEEFIRV